MDRDLTRGPVMKTMLLFAMPMILGDLLQQCYNVADTLIVGRFLGADALAAVGSAFTLMTFLTSILLGLSLGSGAVFSICFGQRDMGRLREGIRASFALLAAVTALLCALVYGFSEQILDFMRVTGTVRDLMREYLLVIFAGLPAIFLYNYYAALLRSVGDSTSPLIFLAVSAVMNIGLDLWFVAGLERGVAGAAEATVISQYVSGVGILLYARKKTARPALEGGAGAAFAHEGDRQFFVADLYPAVDHESGHPHGAGAGEQLWHHGDGRLCRGGEDRRLRLSAGAGLWQRRFHLHRPELRRGQ